MTRTIDWRIEVASRPGLDLAIVAVNRQERAALRQLLQLYLHDFSEFAEIGSPHGDVDRDGLFAYPYLDLYWIEKTRLPLWLRVGKRPAGFVLVNDWPASGQPVDHAVAEFFVMRKYRRAGIGTAAARALFLRLPGLWEVPVAHYNRPAIAFWRRVVDGLDAEDGQVLQGDGVRWSGPIHRFRTRATR